MLLPIETAQEAARNHGLTISEIEDWKDKFLLGAENALRSRPKDEEALKDEQIQRPDRKLTKGRLGFLNIIKGNAFIQKLP